jgi:ribonuclease D
MKIKMEKHASHRRNHRQQSHNQSHAEAKITPVLQGNPLVPTDDAVWVEEESHFIHLCEELQTNKVFAFDTEFIGEDSYYPFTCLIQVATVQGVSLLDPFKIKDLTPLYSLITDPEITVLLHSGSQDLDPVARLLGKPPQAIFDTQIAAGLIGFPWPLSLTNTIETVLGHDVGGHFTFSQWDARPLSNRQRIYAADDVRYLMAVHDFINRQLDELGRRSWAEEEFSKFTSMSSYEFDLQSVVKRICRNKNPRKKELQRIQAIAMLREEIAIKRNLPTRAIIPNECVLALGKKPVETVQQLVVMKGFPKNIAKQYGEQIINAIEKSYEHEPVPMRRPNQIEKDTIIRQELDGAWSLFNAWCIGNKLSAGLVTSRPIFTDWYLAIREGSELPKSPLTEGWRNEVSTQFSQMIRGKKELIFSYDNGFHARSASE